jgi:hypothetical protein
MATPETLDYYCTTVKVPRSVQQSLQAEQARRVLDKGKKVSLNELASELLTKAAESLPQ